MIEIDGFSIFAGFGLGCMVGIMAMITIAAWGD